jgi:hypothetical protein
MGPGARQPVPDTRPISIRLDHRPREASRKGLIELVGSATYGLTEHFEGEVAQVTLTIAYRFIEDERVGEHAELSVTPPSGFVEAKPGVFTGVLEREDEARFEFVSVPYDATWSGRLIVNGEVDRAVIGEARSE